EEISKDDVKRVEDAARAINLGPDQELLHDIPQEYKVDNQGGISDPLSMTGLRLEVDMYLVSVQSTAVQNLRKSSGRDTGWSRWYWSPSPRRSRCSPKRKRSWAARCSSWEAAPPTWRFSAMA